MEEIANKIIEGLPEEEYAAMPYLSASVIRATLKHNQDHVYKIMGQRSFDTQVHSLGRWIHYFILEAPDSSPEENETCPSHLYGEIEKARTALSENSEYLDLIRASKKEVTVTWKDAQFDAGAKARLDIYHSKGIWDLKCIRGGFEQKNFDQKLKKMGWPLQAWWYQRAIKELTGESLETGYLIIDTQSWKIRQQVLSKSELEKASNQARESIRKLKRWGFI